MTKKSFRIQNLKVEIHQKSSRQRNRNSRKIEKTAQNKHVGGAENNSDRKFGISDHIIL